MQQHIAPVSATDASELPIWSWSILGMVLIVDAAWLLLTPLSLHSGSYAEIGALGTLAFVLFLSRRWIKSAQLQTLLMGARFGLLAWPALRLFNHLTMTTALPLADAQLAAWDNELGVNWLAYVQWIDQYPTLLYIMSVCYTGLTVYSCGIYIGLILWGKSNRAQEFLTLFLLTAIIISVIGMFFPAASAMVHYAPGSDAFQNIPANSGTYHLRHLTELRANPSSVVSLSDLPGL